MLTVVVWKWFQKSSRIHYDSDHVNTFYNMFSRNYIGDWEMICFTDDADGIREEIKTYDIPTEFATLQNPFGEEFPSCYRRLSIFGPLQEYVKERFVSFDLDCVITGNINRILNRSDDIVFFESALRAPDYNGSIFMAKKGKHLDLYDDFSPNLSPDITTQAGKKGSDQGWFSFKKPNHPVWTSEKHGIYCWKPQIVKQKHYLPLGCRIVFFPGPQKPWQEQQYHSVQWIRDNYR
jgi:hypothetical protein